LNGADLRKLPIEDCRAKLAHLLRAQPDGLQFSESIAGNGAKVFRHACALGAEGVVSKRWYSGHNTFTQPGLRPHT
jgi:bifunctional non-homologous end joining protein LigD